MTDLPAINEALLDLVDGIGPTRISLTAHRHTALGRDPLSGAGARISGGRWNPPGIPTIYLASPREAAAAELNHLAEVTGVKVESLLRAGRVMHTIQVTELAVLDLRPPGVIESLGLSDEDLALDDRTASAAIGQAAWFLHFSGVLAPSARHADGVVIAAFEDRVTSELAHCDSIQLK